MSSVRPLSLAAQDAIEDLPTNFMSALSMTQHQQVLEAFSQLDFLSKDSQHPKLFQLRCLISLLSARHVVLRAATGSRKTLTMILPLLLSPDKTAITITPLKLLQHDHVQEFEQYGIPLIAINCDTPSDKNLWNVGPSRSPIPVPKFPFPRSPVPRSPFPFPRSPVPPFPRPRSPFPRSPVPPFPVPRVPVPPFPPSPVPPFPNSPIPPSLRSPNFPCVGTRPRTLASVPSIPLCFGTSVQAVPSAPLLPLVPTAVVSHLPPVGQNNPRPTFLHSPSSPSVLLQRTPVPTSCRNS
ncbi:uncharacterized protein EDB91DRAFT_1241303 [Suillus paluster]|uniref:uncharacterized protein n=1 Tax=Suillus paluster TaxID=48578 RepID=UPI001B875A1F|nr:uncharacterized protein EDB91DRAFT_1241303 [Suillus paluster]KAG1756204.1 hypothetical protein EDB91DRAFT_1241303 [Suillus paluster]